MLPPLEACFVLDLEYEVLEDSTGFMYGMIALRRRPLAPPLLLRNFSAQIVDITTGHFVRRCFYAINPLMAHFLAFQTNPKGLRVNTLKVSHYAQILVALELDRSLNAYYALRITLPFAENGKRFCVGNISLHSHPTGVHGLPPFTVG